MIECGAHARQHWLAPNLGADVWHIIWSFGCTIEGRKLRSVKPGVGTPDARKVRCIGAWRTESQVYWRPTRRKSGGTTPAFDSLLRQTSGVRQNPREPPILSSKKRANYLTWLLCGQAGVWLRIDMAGMVKTRRPSGIFTRFWLMVAEYFSHAVPMENSSLCIHYGLSAGPGVYNIFKFSSFGFWWLGLISIGAPSICFLSQRFVAGNVGNGEFSWKYFSRVLKVARAFGRLQQWHHFHHFNKGQRMTECLLAFRKATGLKFCIELSKKDLFAQLLELWLHWKFALLGKDRSCTPAVLAQRNVWHKMRDSQPVISLFVIPACFARLSRSRMPECCGHFHLAQRSLHSHPSQRED